MCCIKIQTKLGGTKAFDAQILPEAIEIQPTSLSRTAVQSLECILSQRLTDMSYFLIVSSCLSIMVDSTLPNQHSGYLSAGYVLHGYRMRYKLTRSWNLMTCCWKLWSPARSSDKCNGFLDLLGLLDDHTRETNHRALENWLFSLLAISCVVKTAVYWHHFMVHHPGVHHKAFWHHFPSLTWGRLEKTHLEKGW